MHGPTTSPRLTVTLTLGLLLWALGSLPAPAADWPQWRGPQRDGRSPDTGLMGSWPEGGLPLLFKATGLGGGFSSLAVAGERIYTLGDLGEAQHVLALSRQNGAVLWKTRVGPAWEDEYLGPRSTPTVDGDRLYVLTTEGEVICLDAGTGERRWSRSLPADYGASMMKAKGSYDWKFSESPLVDGRRVVVTPGTRQAALVALDKMTGKEIWKAAIPELGQQGEDGAAYASVVVAETGGLRQYVQLVGRGLIGVAADDGRFLWGYNRVANGTANIPTPIIHGNHVFASSGYGTGAALLRLERQQDGVRAREVYFLPADVMQNHHGGLILDQGHIYTGTGHNKGFPLSLKLDTGEVTWGPVRNAGSGSAAVAYADGRLYFRYQNGLMVLVEATPAAYREHGSFQIPSVTHPSWAHPVIIGGRLYLREQDNLYVYDVRDRPAAAAPETTATGILNARSPASGLLTGGQLTREQMAALHAQGYTRFINLRPAHEQGTGWEEEYARAHGIDFVRLPVAGVDDISTENAQRLAAELEAAGGAPAVVYCGSGNRVGALLALKARSLDGHGAEEALALGRNAGLTGLEPAVRRILGLPAGGP